MVSRAASGEVSSAVIGEEGFSHTYLLVVSLLVCIPKQAASLEEGDLARGFVFSLNMGGKVCIYIQFNLIRNIMNIQRKITTPALFP